MSPDALDRPIFPLRRKFHYHNFTLEGLEETKKGQVGNVGDPVEYLESALPPKGEEGDDAKTATEVNVDSPLFKYDIRGYRLPIDEQGRWLRTTGNWRPSSYSPAEWNKLSKVDKDVLREAYKDSQKVIH